MTQNMVCAQSGARMISMSLLASVLTWPAAAVSQEAAFDYERFQCDGIHREGKVLEAEPPMLVKATTVFSCVERSCVHHEQIKADDGTLSDVFMSIYIPSSQQAFLFTKAVWTPNKDSPEDHYSIEYPFGRCAKLKVALDENLWTIDLGEIRYEGDEVHAVPDAGPDTDATPSYFFAPTRYHGDWSGLHAIMFELESSGGSYLRAYYQNILGDVVLENGDLLATYEIPKHHDGKWHSFRVPLDGAGWKLWGGATSIAEILKNVTNFKIRAEYGNGVDQTALRNVERE